MQRLNIGDAAAAAGVTPKMVRHYESLGLIPEADRTEAGYRLYGDGEIAMLRFIRQSRTLGFSMEQIGQLMAFWRDPTRRSHDVKQVAQRQLQALLEQQRELDQMRASLEKMVTQCRGDEDAHCVILDGLATAAAPATARNPGQERKRALRVTQPRERRSSGRGAAPVLRREHGLEVVHDALHRAWHVR
ncbi:MerR family DNA-binding protein [Ramlibacter algicola]|uniref:MerR family DNA-binding transcriptional regulator n=1 Tax=Ramlibacter algicola TaxID=2795217 RepID=A0A934UQX3_9BURK|nr:MerR family DNA-binding protein [Ramlibacter algicola]MBK0392590.1 MerR family DNA-binding transcriptional regulator [Ramlibacter algicola]